MLLSLNGLPQKKVQFRTSGSKQVTPWCCWRQKGRHGVVGGERETRKKQQIHLGASYFDTQVCLNIPWNARNNTPRTGLRLGYPDSPISGLEDLDPKWVCCFLVIGFKGKSKGSQPPFGAPDSEPTSRNKAAWSSKLVRTEWKAVLAKVTDM